MYLCNHDVHAYEGVEEQAEVQREMVHHDAVAHYVDFHNPQSADVGSEQEQE